MVKVRNRVINILTKHYLLTFTLLFQLLLLLLIIIFPTFIESLDLYFSNNNSVGTGVLQSIAKPAEKIGNLQVYILTISLILTYHALRYRSLILIYTGVISSSLLVFSVYLLKILTARLGPANSSGEFWENSLNNQPGVFPSGHTALVTLVALLLFYALGEEIKYRWFIYALIVSYESISLWYLSDHWVTDIIFGFALANFIGILTHSSIASLVKK